MPPAVTFQPASLPPGLLGIPYRFVFTTNGGAPLAWTASGLPPGLGFDNATGTISGTPTTAGNYNVAVTVRDTNQSLAAAVFPLPITIPTPQIQITNFVLLPPGTVGTAYTLLLTAAGGAPGYTFSLILGALPGGLKLTPDGTISGIPTAFGSFTFTAQVTDSTGATAAGSFTLTIGPAPLILTTGPLSNAPTGSPLNIQFAATGGIPPYTFVEIGPLPPGAQFSASGALTGTPTTLGTYAFHVFVDDSTNASAGRIYTLTITLPGLIITTPSPLQDGQEGVPYSQPFAATGGKLPYTWKAVGLPTGITLANNTGLLTGIPGQSGVFTPSVTVSDSNDKGIAVTTQNYSLTIAARGLIISGASVPNGTVGTSYSGSVTIAGGDPPYTITPTGLPAGITMSARGVLSGTPTAAGSYTINVTAKDTNGLTVSASYPVTIAPQLVVVTTTAGNGVLGTAFTATLAATGGTPPYFWVGSNLPAGLALASDGTLSGTPTVPGSFSFSVLTIDNNGAAATKTITVTVGLPPGPSVTFNGLSDTAAPATQPRLQIVLGGMYPLPMTVKVTMTVVMDSGPDDPGYQFASGGRTAQTVIQAGSTAGLADIPLQYGTVPAAVTITAQLLAGTQDVTPTPAPKRTIRVNATPPVITSITATRTSTGFRVVLTGYAPSKGPTTANFLFTGTGGAHLQTSQLTLSVGTMFTQWYQSAASGPFGSQFSLTQDFTVNGNISDILSVAANLADTLGTSATFSANLQ